MIEYVDVVKLKPVGDYRMWIEFSNGREGVHDFRGMIDDGGPMVEPLRDPALFRKAFISFDAPTWPNGFAIDATALHMKMAAAGELKPNSAAE